MPGGEDIARANTEGAGRVPAAAMRELLEYDPATGVLTWKRRPEDRPINKAFNKKHAGKPALQYIDSTNGYRTGAVFNRTTYAHRAAFAIMTGRWPIEHIDHINGDRTDNRWVNLRECTQGENNRNRPATASHGYKGICARENGKWVARLKWRGRNLSLGTYETKEEAAAAYDAAARKYCGQFARLNFDREAA